MSSPLLIAQTNTAEVEGVVRDAQGGVLPGATVVAFRVMTGLRIERVTDGAGRFFFAGLPVGSYTITVTLEGFKQVTQAGLLLQIVQRVNLPVTLPPGEQAGTITPTSDP